MLQYLVKGIADFFKRPDTQRAIRNAIMIGLRNPSVRKEIANSAEKVGESIVDFFASITIKITHRQDETRIIIDASSKISYHASDIHNSTVVQGNNKIVINNYNIKLFVTSEDIPELKNMLVRLEHLKERCSVSGSVISGIDSVNNIKIEYESISKELIGRLSRITDYHTLQTALGTED